MRKLQTLTGTLQNEFELKFKYSRIRAGSQFKFQFNKFGDGFPHQIENIIIIEGNDQRDHQTLPEWLYFDEWNRQFRGKVPEEEVGISYEIAIKFSSETNQKTDKFLFTIYQNEGICALELVGGLDTYGYAQDVTTIKIREKIYVLLAVGPIGLKIIEVSDQQNLMLVSSLDTNGVAKQLSTIEIGVTIYVMLADGPAGLKIIDVGDPYNPVLEGRIDTGGDAIGVSTIKIEGKMYAMVADNEEGLQIIDVSDPKNPVLASSISGFLIDQDNNFMIFGNANRVSTMQIQERTYALVGVLSYMEGTGLRIIEVTNLQNPIIVGSIFVDRFDAVVGVSMIQMREKIYALLMNLSGDLFVIEVSDPQNPELRGTISLFSDDFSVGRALSSIEIGAKIYALAVGDGGLKIIDVSDPENPVLVISIFGINSAFGVSPIEIEGIIYALVADYKEGLQLIQIKQSNKQRNYFLPISVSNIETPGQAYDLSIMQQGQQIYALVVDSYAGLLIIEVSDPQNPEEVGYFFDSDANAIGQSPIQIGENIYALLAGGPSGLKIIEVSNPQDPLLVSSKGIGDSTSGVNTLELGEQIYAFVSDADQGLKIIEISDPQNPQIVSSIDTGRTQDVSTMQIGLNIFAIVVCKDLVLKIIKVSDDLQNLVQVGSLPLDDIAQSVCIVEIGIKIYALVAMDDIGLEIIEVSDPENPVLVGSIDTDGKSMGVSTIEMEGIIYAQVADSSGGFKMIELSDPQNPVLVGSVQTSGLAWGVRTMQNGGNIYALVSMGQQFWGLDNKIQGLQIIKLNDNIALYPYINSNINQKQQIREFQVNLYPIYMDTFHAFLDENILISLSIIKREKKQLSPLPYWVSVNLEEKIMNFIPAQKEQLEKLRYIHYTFSTKLNPSDLDGGSGQKTSEDIIVELIKIGYLDPNLFLTKFFDIEKELILDSSFDKLQIKKVLSKYFHQGYFEITIQDFLEQNNRPKIEEGELQRQFDSKVGKTKVTKKIDFQFSDTVFVDPDGDLLTFTITRVQKRDAKGNLNSQIELPDWLTFDKGTRRFQGTPGIEDLGEYTINVQAFDKYEEISQNFTIFLTNHAPIVQEEIPQQFTNLRLGSRYDYKFSESLFKDFDNDTLNFQAEIIYRPKGQNTDIIQLLIPTESFWMSFDSQSRRLTGTPDSTDIQENSEGYDQNFTIKITATDIAEKYVSKEFNLRVTRLFPKLNNKLTIQDQFDQLLESKNIILKVGQKLDFAFSDQTFIHEDNLIYRLQKREETSSDSQSFGNWTDVTQVNDYWLKFDGQNRRIYGTPHKQDIKKYQLKVFANDRYKEIEIRFAFKITNKSPILIIPIKNQIKEAYIDESYEFQFDLNTFYDEDGDNLIYKAELADGKPLPIWLVFKPGDRKFEATPENFDVVRIRLIATDMSEESISDEFELNMKISTFYVLRKILEYAALVLGIIGLVKYRAYIYEIIFKNQYQYKRYEEAKEGEEYYKKISLIREEIAKGFKLWNNLKDNIIQEKKSQNKNIENDWFEQGFMTANIIDEKKLEEGLNRSIELMKIQDFNQYFIDGMIANYLIKKNPSTIKIYEQLKRESSYFVKNNRKVYSPKDWYKEYIKNPQKNEEIQINIIKLEDKLSSLDKMDILNLDKKLLIDIILSNARGINEISDFSPSQGEYVHLDEQKIKMVKAKQKIKEIHGIHLLDRIKKKLRFFKLNLTDIKLIDNRKLPAWLHVEILQNNLYLWGTPQKEDLGEIIIQIIDVNNFILREFTIDVSKKEETNLNSNKMTDVFNISLKSSQIENKNCEISSHNDEPIANQIRDLNSPRIPQQIQLTEIVSNFFQSSTKLQPEIEINIQNKQQ